VSFHREKLTILGKDTPEMEFLSIAFEAGVDEWFVGNHRNGSGRRNRIDEGDDGPIDRAHHRFIGRAIRKFSSLRRDQ